MHNVIDIIKVFFEKKFSVPFSIKTLNDIEITNSIGDLAVNIVLNIDNTNYSLYYFMDRKFFRNSIKIIISEINDFDFNSNLADKVIYELNNQLVKKIEDSLKLKIEITEQNIINDYQSKINDEAIKLSVTSLHSEQGDFLVGLLSDESQKTLKKNVSQQNKSPKEDSESETRDILKTNKNKVFNSSIIVKEKADDNNPQTSIISTVQLLEIKKQVLTSLNEIKELRGDSEFLLRKAKAVTDLTKLWFDILKEEN